MTELRATPAPPLQLTAELVRAHQAALWRYLRVLGCATDAAEDLVQETFVALLRARLEDRGAAALRTWLRSTARHLFFAHCRRTRRSPLAADAEAIEAAWAAYERDDDGDAYRAALRACLDALPARQRELLELQLHERATPAQLGAVAGLAPEGARSRLRRIKQALRQCVHRRLA